MFELVLTPPGVPLLSLSLHICTMEMILVSTSWLSRYLYIIEKIKKNHPYKVLSMGLGT